MQAFLSGRSNIAQSAAVFVLTLAALILLGFVLAYWTWAWFAPRAEPRVQAAAVQTGGAASAGELFGRVQRAQNSAPAPTGIAIKLLGVVAASRGRLGYAVVQLDAKQILAVAEKNDLAPGIRLAEVHPDHVILERSGVRETLAWPEVRAAAGSPVYVPGAAVPAAAAPAAPQAAIPRSRRSEE